MASYINKDFFSEVWLSLIDYTRKRVRAAKTVMYRTLIARHLDAYLTVANYQRPQLLYSQQSVLIEGQKMYVSYSNNIQMRFGSHLRRVVNVMLNVRQRKENPQRVLRARGITEDQIRDQITESITTPSRNFKMFISQRHTIPESLQNAFIAQEFPKDPIYTNTVNLFKYFLTSYPSTHMFLKKKKAYATT